MNAAAAPGLFVTAGAMRRGAIPTLQGGAGSVVMTRAVVIVLPLVGLLLALVLITAGCGPPN